LINKMHGCCMGYVIYGFQENESNRMIDSEWMEEYYSGVSHFAADEYLLYGFVCQLNRETGIPTLSEGTKQVVNKLYRHFLTSKNLTTNDVPIGYYVVVDGDYDLTHESYTLNE